MSLKRKRDIDEESLTYEEETMKILFDQNNREHDFNFNKRNVKTRKTTNGGKQISYYDSNGIYEFELIQQVTLIVKNKKPSIAIRKLTKLFEKYVSSRYENIEFNNDFITHRKNKNNGNFYYTYKDEEEDIYLQERGELNWHKGDIDTFITIDISVKGYTYKKTHY